MIDPTRHHGLDLVRAVADEWGIDATHQPYNLGTIRLPRVAAARNLRPGGPAAAMSML